MISVIEVPVSEISDNVVSYSPLMPISTVKPSTCSAGVLVERLLASTQSAAARLHQKVQECNVMARGMSSIDSPSVRPLSSDCLAPAISGNRQGRYYTRRPLSAAKPSPRWILVHGKHLEQKTPTDLYGFNVIYGVL